MKRPSIFALLGALLLLLTLESPAQKIRLVAGNISSGTKQSYDPGHGSRIFKGLKGDVIMIQEFNYGTNSTADIREFVTNTFGAEFSYSRGPTAQIPNGVISRFPILSQGSWTDPQVGNRNFVWARIDLPGTKELWAISVHMLTTDSKRGPEATALKNFILANVPATDYVVIGGDFNASSRTEAQFGIFDAVVRTDGPYPADNDGDGTTNHNRNKPYDNVLVEEDLHALQVPVVIGNNSFPGGLVVDTRVYTPISDLSPALVSDSDETYMQHMAVVKDFQLPGVPLIVTSSPSLEDGTVGSEYSQTLSASGGTFPYAWSLASGVLPAGVTLSTGGVVGGTPTASGTFTFASKVTDGAAGSTTTTFTMVVTPALTISTASPLAGGSVGRAYSQTLAATGGTAPYVWTLQSSTLPTGLTLSAAGVLGGTPTAAGNFTFTAKVTDSIEAISTKTFTVTITPALAISTTALAGGTVGGAYSQTFSGTGGTSPYTWSVASGSTPPGLVLAAGGVISGTPTDAGSFQFTARLSDSAGATATRIFVISVREPLALYLESYGLAADSELLDSDGDGVVNLVEYLLGGNPRVADPSILPTIAYDAATSEMVYRFKVRAEAGSLTWQVQSSTSLTAWPDLSEVDGATITAAAVGGGMEEISIYFPATEAKRFVRLFVSGP